MEGGVIDHRTRTLGSTKSLKAQTGEVPAKDACGEKITPKGDRGKKTERSTVSGLAKEKKTSGEKRRHRQFYFGRAGSQKAGDTPLSTLGQGMFHTHWGKGTEF